jgi:hypothetical protein
MSTPTEVRKVEVTDQSIEELVQSLVRIEAEGLNDDQKLLLSKALFPDTHTSEVEIAGQTRTFKPMTIKFARRINEDLKELQKRVQKAVSDNSAVRVDQDMLDGLVKVSNIICEFYGWEDLTQKIAEGDVTNEELLTMAMTQQNVQGTNDFLLMPLRLLLKVAQLHEILAIRLSKPSISSPSN